MSSSHICSTVNYLAVKEIISAHQRSWSHQRRRREHSQSESTLSTHRLRCYRVPRRDGYQDKSNGLLGVFRTRGIITRFCNLVRYWRQHPLGWTTPSDVLP